MRMTGLEGHRLFLESAKQGGHSEREARALWHIWLMDRLECSRTKWMLEEREPMAQGLENCLREDAIRLSQGVPIQYITGKINFAGVAINVGPGVLIPRPETEAWVVEWTLKLPSNARVMDVCSGSGCMGLAVAHASPDAAVTAVEWSPEALGWLHKNAEPLKNAEVLRWDALSDPPARPASLDLLISNPPYIPQNEASMLDSHVVDHEPPVALFVPDEDPLVFYRSLIAWGEYLLKPQAWISLECHTQKAEEVRALFVGPGWASVAVQTDIFDRPRFVSAQWLGIFTP
jgi:release factor glutamine methyltransferase